MLWERMDNRLDQGNASYVNFLLQSGVVKCQSGSESEPSLASVRYKCKKCRRLLASSRNVLPHMAGNSSHVFERW